MNKYLVIFLIIFCSKVFAIEQQWQLGAGIGALDLRLYPGSRQTKTYVLPLPYFTYQSEYLEIDRGIRGIFSPDPDSAWYLDISADFGIPVDSSDSVVRAEMSDLDAVIQFGPSVKRTLAGHRSAERELRLEFPLRTAISVDIQHPKNEGWVFEPRLVYEKRRVGRSGLFAKARLGLRYATQDYHSYYYDVTSADATPQRSAFESDKGYGGLVLDLRAAWRQDDILYWGIIRYQNLNNAVYEKSPLVEDNDYYFVGVGITWILAASH